MKAAVLGRSHDDGRAAKRSGMRASSSEWDAASCPNLRRATRIFLSIADSEQCAAKHDPFAKEVRAFLRRKRQTPSDHLDEGGLSRRRAIGRQDPARYRVRGLLVPSITTPSASG